MKICIIESCYQCRYSFYDEEDSGYGGNYQGACDYNDFRAVDNMTTIPNWCPLEERKEIIYE